MSTMDTTIVLDYGSKTFKAGYSSDFPSEEAPRIIIPNAVEILRASTSAPDALLASGAPSSTSSDLPIHFPVQRGRITNFAEFESLLHYILYDLAEWVPGEEGNVIIAEPLLTPRADREAVAQLMFETFNVNGYYTQDAATLSLFAVGRISGCVLDIGHGKVDVATVFEGQLNSSSVRRLPVAGEDLTRLLEARLARRGAAPRTTHDVEALKELCARCAESPADYDATDGGGAAGGSGATTGGDETFTLPDGQSVTVTRRERCEAAEALLRPGVVVGRAAAGLSEAALECIVTQTDGTSRKGVYEGVLLCGGGAAIPGLAQRLLLELRQLAPPSAAVALCAVPEYMTAAHTARFAPWVGGAVLAKTLMQQSSHMVTKGDYDEAGPTAVHRKCA